MFRVKYNKTKKNWSSDEAPYVFNQNVSLGHILLRSMDLCGSKMSQINADTGEQFTFEEMRLKTVRAAQNLQRRGFNSKCTIATVAANVPHLAPIVYASLCLGCPVAPMYTSMEKPTVLRMFELTEPRIIFCEVKAYDLMVECLAEAKILDAKIFTFDGVKGDSEAVDNLFRVTGSERDFVPVDVDGVNETAIIMPTSGSTGPSKGARLSHAALAAEIDNTQPIYANEIIFNPSTLFWISGVFTILMGTICGGTRVITTEEFSSEMQLRIIEEYKATIVENQSFYLLEMLKSGLLPKANLSSVKSLFAGGFKVPDSIMNEFNRYLPNGSVCNAYGITEIGYNIAIDYPYFTGKGGRITNGFSVKIVDEQNNACGAGVDGEICFKGRSKFLGYCKNQQLTDEAFDEDGYFRSGDIGRIDSNGYLYIVDRKKNVISYHNDWVFPADVEEVLLKSHQIKYVCVVGVPYDEILELPAAVVVRANGYEITEQEICKMVEDNLWDDCKLRGGVYFVDSLPMTVAGKPIRGSIKKIATDFYKKKQIINNMH